MRAYISFILRHRIALLIVCALISAAALAVASRARIASSIGGQFLGDSPAYRQYLDLSRRFAHDEVLLVGLDDPHYLSAQGLARLRQAVDEVEAFDDVAKVHSVLSAQHIEGQDGELHISSYAEQARARPHEVADIARAFREDPSVAGLLVADDGKSHAVLIELRPDAARSAEATSAVVFDLEACFIAAGYAVDAVHPVGFVSVMAEVLEATNFNLARLFPFVAFILLATVWLLFRRPWPAFLSLGVSFLAVLWTMAGVILFEPNLNILIAMLPAVILVVAFSDVVHLCSAYLKEIDHGAEKDTAIRGVGEEVGKACLFTSATTFVGFVSIGIAPHPLARTLGLAMGFGVGVALLLAVTLVPIAFSFMRKPEPLGGGATGRVHAWLDRLLAASHRLGTRSPRLVITGFAAVLFASLAVLPGLVLEADFSQRFSEDKKVQIDERWFNERFASANLLEVYINAPAGEDLLDPKRLAAVAAFQDELSQNKDFDSATSLIDLLRRLHGVLIPEAQAGSVPMSRAALAQYLLLFEMSGGEELDSLIDTERETMRIGVRMSGGEMRAAAATGVEVRRLARERLAGLADVEVTGMTFLLGHFFEEIFGGQKIGLLLSFVVIALMMCGLLRSVRFGLWSMVPNLLPVIVLGGYVAVAYDYVDTDTIIVAVMAIGIGVDDTIHFLVRYRIEAAREGADLASALRGTFAYAGRGILMTTVILVAGFSAFATSDYYTIHALGALLPLSLVVALLADLLLIPALLQMGWMERTKDQTGSHPEGAKSGSSWRLAASPNKRRKPGNQELGSG